MHAKKKFKQRQFFTHYRLFLVGMSQCSLDSVASFEFAAPSLYLVAPIYQSHMSVTKTKKNISS